MRGDVADSRLVSARPLADDAGFDQSLRPRRLSEYVGQPHVVTNLQVAIEAARSRGGIVHRLDFYSQSDLEFIVTRSARILGVPIDAEGSREIARRSRGTPRI